MWSKPLKHRSKPFFDSAPPLHNSHDITQKLNQFIQRNSSSSDNRSTLSSAANGIVPTAAVQKTRYCFE
ncbi:unnamed protein product [Lathyrus oleraceus]